MGAHIQLAVVDLHAPDVLVLIAAKAGLQAGETAVGEHLGGVAHHQLHILVLVHAVQVHGLVQVGVEEPAIQAAAKLAVGVFTGLGEQDPLQSDLLVVVLADVQVIVEHHQVGCAGTGALRVDAKGVPGTVLFLVASHRGPGEGTVGILVTTHQCKGLHGVVVGHIVLGAGADGNIQAVVVLHHIPDAAAVDAVRIAVSRVVEQAVGICDLGKALFRVGGDQQGGTALAGSGVHGHVADDQLVVVDAHPTDAGADALLISCGIVLCAVQADVHRLAFVSLRVHLPHAGQKADAAAAHTAAEVQLAVVLDGIAEQRGMTVEGAGHQHLGLAGLGVDLCQHTLGIAAVGLFQEEGAVVEGVKGSLQDLVIELVPQAALHQREGVADGCVAGAHIDPIAVTHSGPGVVLATVAGIVALGLRVGHHVHCAIAQIVHNAVCDLDVLFRVRELFKRIAVFVVVEGIFLVDIVCREQAFPCVGAFCILCALRRGQQLHRRCQQHPRCQHTADDSFPVHGVLLFYCFFPQRTPVSEALSFTKYEESVKNESSIPQVAFRAQVFFCENHPENAENRPAPENRAAVGCCGKRFTRGLRSRCTGPRSSWRRHPS